MHKCTVIYCLSNKYFIFIFFNIDVLLVVVDAAFKHCITLVWAEDKVVVMLLLL